VNDQLAEKVCELEQQYVQQRAPIYEKRAAVCSKIPYFWSTALRNHPLTTTLIKEDDDDMLYHLTDVSLPCQPPPGTFCINLLRRLQLLVKDNADIRTGCYEIVLRFSDNPYFTNKVIFCCAYPYCRPSTVHCKAAFLAGACKITHDQGRWQLGYQLYTCPVEGQQGEWRRLPDCNFAPGRPSTRPEWPRRVKRQRR
jgi:hypothetical protein